MSAYFGLLAHYAARVGWTRLGNETDVSGFARPVLSGVESELLIPWADRVRKHWVAEACGARFRLVGKHCRFLFVSFFGRHFLKTFSRWFPDAIFLTNAAESSWLQQDADGRAFYHWPQEHAASATSKIVPSSQLTPRANSKPAWIGDPSSHYYGDGFPEPSAPHDVPIPLPVLSQWTDRSSEWDSRDLFALFVGQPVSNVRRALVRTFGEYDELPLERQATIQDVRIYTKRRFPVAEFSALMHRSKLCLVPDGDQPNTERLVESVAHGCVPVIISSRLQPPFHKLLLWERCAIFVQEEQVGRLPQLFDELSVRQDYLRELHMRSRALFAALHWEGEVQNSAFTHLLIAELSRQVRNLNDHAQPEHSDGAEPAVPPPMLPRVRKLKFPLRAFEIKLPAASNASRGRSRRYHQKQ